MTALDTDFTISVVDVENTYRNMRASLDKLWPTGTTRPPSKEQVAAVFGDMRLALIQKATLNLRRIESPFMQAAMRVTNTEPKIYATPVEVTSEKSEMELKHEALREARRKRLVNRE
jgi:hypothetical protein